MPKIVERKDGRKQMAYWAVDINGAKERKFVYGKTNKEVTEKYQKALADAMDGHTVKASKINVAQYLEDWVDRARKIRESTRINYKGEIHKHIVPKIGKVKLQNLNPAIVQKMMDSLIKEGVSPRTTRILKNILSKALKEAEMHNLVKPDIMKYVELETYRPKQRVIWSEEDAKIFSEAIKDNKYYFFYLMYITYGLRRGEAIAIKWSDVDFHTGTIHIRRQYTIVGKIPTICDLKTTNSVRDLPILPHIEKVLQSLKHNNENDYILSYLGEPINPLSVNYEFNQIIKHYNLPKVTLHSLRHFAATSFKNAGVTIKEAQEILGHSTPVTTMQYYQHSSLEDKKIALAKYAENMSF